LKTLKKNYKRQKPYSNMPNKIKNKRTGSRLQRKILKKVNFFNISTCIFSICTGYMVVSFFNLTGNGGNPDNNQLETISQSASRLADSFELYNQKKFYSDSVSSSP
jgi:hypothetical protein